MKYSIYTLVACLIMFSCGSRPKIQEPLQENCKDYFDELYTPMEADYFSKHLIKNKELSTDNELFITALTEQLKAAKKDASQKYAFEKVLFPIYTLKEAETSVFGLTEEITKEELDKIPLSKGEEAHDNLCVKKYDHFFEKTYHTSHYEIYVYSFTKMFKTNLLDRYYWGNDCLSYFRYSFERKEIPANSPLLIGSKYPIELEYRDFPEIDSLFSRKLMKECADCPNDWLLVKTFAKVKGIDNLYFIYADTFPLTTLNTPIRGLVLNVNNKLKYVWTEELDLFGCPCL